MKKTKASNIATSKAKPSSGSATSKNLQTELLLSLGKNENLSGILADKNVLINNLISRAGDLEQMMLEKDEYAGNLEQMILGKDEYAENLAQSLKKQENYIGEQNTAITLHDEHVTHLDQHITQQSDAISQRNEHVARLEGKNSEAFKLLKECLTLGASINEIDQNLIKLGNLENSISGWTSHIAQLHAQLRIYDSQRDESLVNRIVGYSQEVERLQNEIKAKDSWGAEIQNRLHQLNNELLAFKSSTWWRLTAPFRGTVELVLLFLGQLFKLIKLPYKLLAKIGWTLMPKLFHRAYHSSLTQRVMQRQQASVIESFIGEQNTVQTPPASPLPIISAAIPEQQNPHNKWRLGERIDGPRQG